VGSRQLPIALRVGAVALWIVFLIGMVNWSNTHAAVVGAGVGTVALGLLVGRWWVLLVAVVPGAVVALGVLVSDPDNYYEGSPGSYAAAVAMLAVVIAALLALGVAIHRSAGSLRNR
jgi:hypothetical protein